ncbi:MAG: glycosyltransferase family 4 protein [Bacteroidota bacterium]
MQNSDKNINPTKNICFFNSARSWGGGEKWHYDMATALEQKSISVFAVTNKKSELFHKLKEQKIKIFSIKISNISFLNPFKIAKVSRILKKEKTSTIIINLPADLKVAGPAAKLAGVKKIIYRRGSAIPIKNTFLNRLLFTYFIDEIIANSQATKNTILANNPSLFNPEKIKVIYNGVEDPATDVSFAPIYQKQPAELVLGNAGRFVKQKNHKFLIDLAQALAKEGLNFKLLLAGNGKLKQETIDYAVEKKVDGKIIFPGFIENIKSFMHSIDIYILPSLWEGFGYVLVEAMACKKPVIAFNLSSNPEIIEDKKTGYLVKKNDLNEVIHKIKLLAESPALRQKMGEEGIKRVKKLFTIERAIEQITQTIE